MGVVERTVSECSEDIDIRPLELEDLQLMHEDESDDERRYSISELHGSDKFFSVVYGLKKKRESNNTEQQRKSMLARMAWKNAYNKIKAMGDPWEKFEIRKFATEKAKRFRYKALQKKWVEDEVLIKMEKSPFNHGAMRECFRMKKLSNFSHDDWSKAHNYVAKRYMDRNTPDKTYYDDVKLQMDAKLWGEEYNRHNPPKKVDIFQMVVIQLVERPGTPLYHVEHFIEGNYIKYNSNSGYVSAKKNRMTPHAFSHFTFERSGHELIVVDIQGVGDLYTDPQIHTAHGNDYGDGNLGTRGMALFFHSHSCNSICRSLGLSPFDMAPSELLELKKEVNKQVTPKTRVRGTEELVTLPTEEQRNDLHEYLRQRSLSSGCVTLDDENILNNLNMGSYESMDSIDEQGQLDDSEDSAIASARKNHINMLRGQRVRRSMSHSLESPLAAVGSPPDSASRRHHSGGEQDVLGGLLSITPDTGSRGSLRSPRKRIDSSSSECDDSVTRLDMVNFSALVSRRSRPSNIINASEHEQLLQELDMPRASSVNTILGQVHLDVAKYHELNRFTEEGDEFDCEAAKFHVLQAAHCGLVEGLLAAAQLLIGMPHYILPEVELPEEERDELLGFRFLEEACRAGDRWAIVYVATALDQGLGLPPGRSLNWKVAYALYERALTNCETDDEGGYDATMDTPPYLLRARQATMILQGGHGLDRDPTRAGELFSEAAELATEAMKGKLANKYYMDAENAWAECEE